MIRRPLAPPAKLPPASKRCRNLACNNLRPAPAKPFCETCWDKLPRDYRRDLVESDSPRQRNGLTVLAAEFLTLRAEDDLAYCWICGCTEEAACPGGCCWASDDKHPDRDVCSRCVEASSREP